VKVICPKCSQEAPWLENKSKYGKNYGKSYMCYYCKDCDTYVGCHNNTRQPLGTMADKELRDERMKTHNLFDNLWKSGQMNRKKAYKLLNNYFGKEIHIGQSDKEMCQKIRSFILNSPPNKGR